jgi:hypothetical protein
MVVPSMPHAAEVQMKMKTIAMTLFVMASLLLIRSWCVSRAVAAFAAKILDCEHSGKVLCIAK